VNSDISRHQPRGGIIPQNAEWRMGKVGWMYSLLLSLKVFTNLGIAKRPILLVLFFKEKNKGVSVYYLIILQIYKGLTDFNRILMIKDDYST
jgi:hypothetical protein